MALSGEGALSLLGKRIDWALLMGSSLEKENLSLGARLIRAGTDFPGERTDEEGLELSLALPLENISLEASFKLLHDNVNGNPLNPTITDLIFNNTLKLSLKDLPSLNLRFHSISKSSKGPPPYTDQVKSSISLGISHSAGPLSISVSTKRGKILDNVAGTESDLTGAGVGLSVNIGEFLGEFGFTSETTDHVQSEQVGVSLKFSGPPGSFSCQITQKDDKLKISSGANLVTKVTQNTDISLGGEVGISQERLAFTANVGITTSFDLPIPFLVTKGRVEGHVFIDENGNGILDKGEGVSGLLLKMDEVLARTDEEGLYRFPPLKPGEYEVNLRDLPTGLASEVSLPHRISLGEGEVLEANFPLRKVAGIDGLVFHDENRNGKLEEGEGGIPGVKIVLISERLPSQEVFTNPHGRYTFVDLVPGRYRIRVDKDTLPKKFELTTRGELSVTLEPEEVRLIKFGAVEKKPVIKFVPTADFTHRPKEPKPEATVIFDGSSSFDPDGWIAEYKWDFDTDGVIDATGKVVEYSFPEPGEFHVTLTVQDNDGYTDSETRVINVVPAS